MRPSWVLAKNVWLPTVQNGSNHGLTCIALQRGLMARLFCTVLLKVV